MTSFGSSRSSICFANRQPASSRNWPTWRAPSETSPLDPLASLSEERFQAIVGAAQAARTRIREAAYQQLHRDPYRPEMAPGLLARVPSELDTLNERVVVTVCARLGFAVEHTRGRRTFSIELGNEALVDSLPGVPGGSSFVGSFDREEAVEDETIDFFASGHPLVEGMFAHVEDSPLGRVVRLVLETGSERGAGLVAIYKDGRGVRRGRTRLDRPSPSGLGRGLSLQRPLRARRMRDARSTIQNGPE